MAFYFNSGSLTGDDLVKQILTVITACEIVGLQVKLQMSDAGAGNPRAVSLLCGTTNHKHSEGKP